ncbi:MAG: hypothetical protein H8E44_05190 [Planctomycetes bacterium]|nr:hypothetical protein [Planctomycetota bacterium]MBL7043060.1 hypothetical protein [Pirellulaceae bacterium]
MRKALAVIAVLLLFGCGWLMFAITGCDPSVPAENGAERAQTGPADSARSSDGARLRSIASLQADVARLLDQELAEQSSDYRAAVEEIFYRQVVFCDGTDRPDRVTVSWAPGKQGELRLSLHSPGRHNYGDNHPDAITLYGGAVVGLTFSIESNIDACPCGGPEFPDYLDDEFLKTIARIDTLESIDLSCSGVTDAGLKTLAQLKNLRSVNLERTTLTCDGLKHLGTLHHLETFAYSPGDRSGRIEWIPAQVCEIAAGHRHLRDLRLEWVEFDKKAARALAACAELESLKVTGTLLEADALLAFEGNASLESMHLYFTCRAIGPIRLGGLSRVSRLGVTVEAPNVDIALADLPTVRDLGLFVRHGAPEEAHTAESVGSDRKAAPGPRVSVRRLADLRQASFGVRDRRFESTTEHGVVQLGELPSLANLAFHGLDGKLEVEGTCVNLKRLTASEAAIPASLYQALPRFPQLEELTLFVRPSSIVRC